MRLGTLRGWLIVGIAASVLSGCGFQLRGGADLPNVDSIRVNAANASMRDELAVFLQDGGARVVRDADSLVDAVLTVSGEAFDRRVLSVDPSTGKAREYELAYTVNFAMVDGKGKPMVDQQSIRLIRDFVFDEDAVIGKSREENVLRDEMRRDAMQQIIRRLRASLGA
jgi:LPS-assembly lipoprotein